MSRFEQYSPVGPQRSLRRCMINTEYIILLVLSAADCDIFIMINLTLCQQVHRKVVPQGALMAIHKPQRCAWCHNSNEITLLSVLKARIVPQVEWTIYEQ